ncbi:hypothetical protein JCM10207_007286 [Rhodosporidiobolus poonsookiae]
MAPVNSLLSTLPTPLASFLITTNLTHPLNFALLLFLLCTLVSLVPSTPVVPQPWDVPPAPSSSGAYTWRPSAHAPAQKWTQYTPQELRAYDGTADGGKGEKGRVLLAIRRRVYDVSAGRGFYGPGGPYAIFAGRDASRGLAKQSFDASMLTPVDAPIDPLDDLVGSEWGGLREWEEMFRSKYIQCGDLVSSH